MAVKSGITLVIADSGPLKSRACTQTLPDDTSRPLPPWLLPPFVHFGVTCQSPHPGVVPPACGGPWHCPVTLVQASPCPDLSVSPHWVPVPLPGELWLQLSLPHNPFLASLTRTSSPLGWALHLHQAACHPRSCLARFLKHTWTWLAYPCLYCSKLPRPAQPSPSWHRSRDAPTHVGGPATKL